MITGEGERIDLWDHVAAQPRLTGRTVEIGAGGGRRARNKRTAKLDLRAVRVTLAPPRDAADQAPPTMLAVSAIEPNPPAGKDPLNWLLLTTEGQADAETANTVISWYERQWTIEECFKVLKVRTRIKDRRLNDADEFRKCLAFDVITDDEIFISYIQLQHLNVIRAPPPPGIMPDIRTFVIDLASLVGFHPRKQQPMPGTQKVCEGYVILKHTTRAYHALKEQNMIRSLDTTMGG